MAEVLQEYFDSRGVVVKVDPTEGILQGVKLLGLESRNGRRYQESALCNARTLYEGAKVNVNHPKDGPLAPRDYQDRLGVIRNVEFQKGNGLFGDFHFNPKHSLAEQLLWDAKHNPRNVGFSHNVLARIANKEGVALVEEITHVQSVDLVADPATTQGLFEEAESKADPEELKIWDALTLETLQMHRPDLLAEIRTISTQILNEEIKDAQAKVELLQKRERIIALHLKHDLPVPIAKSNKSNKAVSHVFLEMLMKVSNEEEIEKLIAERALLVNSSNRWLKQTFPQSRDQLSLANPSSKESSASDFAKALLI